MAMTRFITRLLLTTTTNRSSSPTFCRSYTSLSLSTSRSPPLPTNFPLLRLRYLTAASLRLPTLAHSTAVRAFATRQTSSALDDPIPESSNQRSQTSSALDDPVPESSNQPLEGSILEDDGPVQWLIVMDDQEGNQSRDEIIDLYIKTLATVVGSEEAPKKIYTISTKEYFLFGAYISRKIARKLVELAPPGVRWVVPDTYSDVKNNKYQAEPFIDGKAVPYDPKYHEEWLNEWNAEVKADAAAETQKILNQQQKKNQKKKKNQST